MKFTPTFLTRPVDDLGRIVIPKDIRTAMQITAGDRFEVFVDNDTRSILYTPDKKGRSTSSEILAIANSIVPNSPQQVHAKKLLEEAAKVLSEQ